MSGEIVNRVANSSLITLDLEDWYPENIIHFDITPFLWEGMILKETEFRALLKNENWERYSGKNIVLKLEDDIIIPSWAHMLIAVYLQPYAKTISTDLVEFLNIYYDNLFKEMDFDKYKNQRVIIKGCSNKHIPQNCYLHLIQKIKPQVKSLMFGEACSTVPLFKR